MSTVFPTLRKYHEGNWISTDEEYKQILEHLEKHASAELPGWIVGWIEGGADRVAAMSNLEASLCWSLHKHKEQSHDIAALMSLEPQTAVSLLDALQKRLADFRSQLGVRTAFLNTYIATRKVQRRIYALRVV